MLLHRKSILSNEELYKRYIETDSPQYLSLIVQNNVYTLIYLVKKIVKNQEHPHYEDLLQEAAIGYYEGLLRYDITKNVKINGFCYIWAMKYVNVYLEKHSGIVRVPQKSFRNGEKVCATEIGNEELMPAKETLSKFEVEMLDVIINNLPSEMQKHINDAMLDRVKNRKYTLAFNKLLKSVKSKSHFIDCVVKYKSYMIPIRDGRFWEYGQFEGGEFFIPAKCVMEYYKEVFKIKIIKKKMGYLLVVN